MQSLTRGAVLAAAILFQMGCSASGEAQSQLWNTQGGAAVIGGYDVVAYFDGQVQRGRSEFQATFRGGTFYFASTQHRDRFRADPAHFAPQYGGYCSFAMARGDRVRVDPNAYSVVDGRLYLNYSLDVRRRWTADRANYIRSADGHWARLNH